LQTAFGIAVADWGIAPSEFWGMSPQEFWWAFDHKYREAMRVRNPGKPSQAEWNDAIARHKAKKNG